MGKFYFLNPELEKLLNNDRSLKGICSAKYLQNIDVSQISCPILVSPSECYFDCTAFDVDNYCRFLLNMIVHFRKNDVIIYRNCSFSQNQVQEIMCLINTAFEVVQAQYVEYFSAVNGIEVKVEMKCWKNAVVGLKLNISFIENYRGAINEIPEFLKLCYYVKMEILRSGKIDRTVQEYAVAALLFNWVVLHIKYDKTLKLRSQTGMSALKYGEAVCNGFTALYNALCKLFGISVVGMAGTAKPKNSNNVEKHIWTWAQIQGRDVFIDTTWGSPVFLGAEKLKKIGIDPDDFCDFNNFDIPLIELRKEHHWKRSIYLI